MTTDPLTPGAINFAFDMLDRMMARALVGDFGLADDQENAAALVLACVAAMAIIDSYRNPENYAQDCREIFLSIASERARKHQEATS